MTIKLVREKERSGVKPMKINSNQSFGYNVSSNDQPLELKEGEIHSAKIKERISDNEAILQIKGKEVRATFEGKVPNGDRVSVQITESLEQKVQVKTVPDHAVHQSQQSKPPQPLQNTADTIASSINQAVKFLQNKGIAIDKEAFQQLKKFMESSLGTIQQKLQTVQSLANKKLDVTLPHLQSVHEAVHGKALAEIMNDVKGLLQVSEQIVNKPATDQASGRTQNTMSNNQSLEKALGQLKDIIANEPDLRKIIQMLQSLSLGKGIEAEATGSNMLQIAAKDVLSLVQQQGGGTSRGQILQILDEMISPTTLSQPIQSVIASMKLMIKSEQSLDQTIQQLKQQINTLPDADQHVFAYLEKSLVEAEKLSQIGWEPLGRERISKALQQVESDLSSVVISSSHPPGRDQIVSENYMANVEWQMASAIASKDLVVSEITKRLSEAANQFKNIKREINRNIDNIVLVAQNNRTNIMPAVKPLLENTIDLLDKAILKSDITMLTDMETEKELLTASTLLAEARKHLAKGENSQAVAVLQEVKTKLESMNWRPSNVRIQHFLTYKSVFMDNELPSLHTIAGKVVDTAQHFQSLEPSARNTYEFIRSLGLNHDSEVAQALASGKRGADLTDSHQNLKAALLQLAKSEGEHVQGTGVSLQTEQALNNLTGQQLLSKSEQGSSLQSMFFSLPLLMGGKLENVKLYLNAKNEGQKIDWENCSLYFMIETKKLGPTGIMVSSVDRNLSITVKNDNPQLKEKIEPLVNKCKENLKAIGYNIAGVNFTRLSIEKKDVPTSDEKTATRPPQVNPTAKGFDFKI